MASNTCSKKTFTVEYPYCPSPFTHGLADIHPPKTGTGNADGAAGDTDGGSMAPTDSVTFELFLKEAAEARRRLRSTGAGDTGLSGTCARLSIL